MYSKTILGIDLGGTLIRGGLVREHQLSGISSRRVMAQGSGDEVWQDLFAFTDPLINDTVEAIGIGVPGLVDSEKGVVYDVVNIPAWKEVNLKKRMEERYRLPVRVNNDANCFVLGEHYFGKGKGYNSLIGLTIGTGLGAGIIINSKLYSGHNGGAGEFGMIDYLDHCFEYYASGQFFRNVYGMDGEKVFEKAKQDETLYLRMYEEMGSHLGNAIKAILYSLDVELVVIGGSVRHAWSFFNRSMWQRVQTFAYQKAKENIQIEVSDLENSGILGAAALHLED